MTGYRRKLSREDAATGTVLITKDRWAGFPPPMVEFAVEAGGQRFATRVVAEDCLCAPPAHSICTWRRAIFATGSSSRPEQ